MLSASDRVVALIGYGEMSADQCDIRQSILRRRGRYDEAKQCILAALAKNPEKAHTRGLLHAGLAEIYRKKDDWRNARTEARTALVFAEEAEKQDPRQAARIYRQCADIADFVEKGAGKPFRRKARELAQATGAEDQLLKI